MQDVNVNGVKGYPMVFSHTTNKETMWQKKWYPIEWEITNILYSYTLYITFIYIFWYGTIVTYGNEAVSVPHHFLLAIFPQMKKTLCPPTLWKFIVFDFPPGQCLYGQLSDMQ